VPSSYVAYTFVPSVNSNGALAVVPPSVGVKGELCGAGQGDIAPVVPLRTTQYSDRSPPRVRKHHHHHPHQQQCDWYVVVI